MVESLLKGKADVNAVNKFNQTPLHLAVNSNDGGTDVTSEVETLLIDHGADLYAMDDLGRTPLQYVFVKMTE